MAVTMDEPEPLVSLAEFSDTDPHSTPNSDDSDDDEDDDEDSEEEYTEEDHSEDDEEFEDDRSDHYSSDLPSTHQAVKYRPDCSRSRTQAILHSRVERTTRTVAILRDTSDEQGGEPAAIPNPTPNQDELEPLKLLDLDHGKWKSIWTAP